MYLLVCSKKQAQNGNTICHVQQGCTQDNEVHCCRDRGQLLPWWLEAGMLFHHYLAVRSRSLCRTERFLPVWDYRTMMQWIWMTTIDPLLCVVNTSTWCFRLHYWLLVCVFFFNRQRWLCSYLDVFWCNVIIFVLLYPVWSWYFFWNKGKNFKWDTQFYDAF